MSEIPRRRFLGGLAAALGLGVTGAAIWSRRSGETPMMAPAPTTPPSTTTAPLESTSTTTTTATTSTTTTTEPPATVGVAIPILCREAWGAQPALGEYVRHEIEHITVHHTAVVLESNTDAPARARQHQAYHQERGWVDLAYHFLIDAAGNVYEGRPVDAVGDTGTEYDPTGHFLVCCEGNFDEQPLPDAQYARLVEMVSWGCAEFGVEPGAVRGHRDVAATSCPGDNLYVHIADGTLADDVDSGTAHRLEMICGERGTALVAAVAGDV